jgi:hypothetical protein
MRTSTSTSSSSSSSKHQLPCACCFKGVSDCHSPLHKPSPLSVAILHCYLVACCRRYYGNTAGLFGAVRLPNVC